MSRTIYIATRGSALALVQSNMILARCRELFPARSFELKVIKTTGDKLQTLNLSTPSQESTKGLFTKELEVAMLAGEADLAVHSLKDLPTELPEGLYLSAVSAREDVRDVLIFQGSKDGGNFRPGMRLEDLPSGAGIATSSTRRQAQLLAARPDLRTFPIRGNVGTRLRKLVEQPEVDAIILALAGLKRLGFQIGPDAALSGTDVPAGLFASILPVEQMLPCVGQAALGIESRFADAEVDLICARLNHDETYHCVTAERAFLRQMGGGCLSPVAAYAQNSESKIRLQAVSFRDEQVRRGERSGAVGDAELIGRDLAKELQ